MAMGNSVRKRYHGRFLLLVVMFLGLGMIAITAATRITTDAEAASGLDEGATINMSEESMASIADLDDHPVEDTDAARADRMLEALEAIPENERISMGLDVEAMRSTPLAQRLEKLQELWTVRQAELREAYDAMPKVNELLSKRIDVLQDADASESTLVEVLTDLEDLLSDIDMARDFHSLGGFPALVEMLHEAQPENVREIAAWAIGTAVKNEPTHQLWVLEGGSNPSALALLLENASVATTPGLRSKTLYALSACLSNNSDVQLQFGSLRGEVVLSSMYDADGSDYRVRTKTLTLLSDLLQEAARGSPAAVLATVPIGSTVNSGGVWCGRVDDALQQGSSPASLEKALEAVVSFAPSCREQFKQLGTKGRLEGIAQQCRTSQPADFEEEAMEFQQELARKLEECAGALR